MSRETIALALRQEAADLEKTGIGIIQIDELALYDGLPLVEEGRVCGLPRLGGAGLPGRRLGGGRRHADPYAYLRRFARRGATGDRRARCQRDLDRDHPFEPNGTLLDTDYPNAIGPGVYNIHLSRVSDEDEIGRRRGARAGAGLPAVGQPRLRAARSRVGAGGCGPACDGGRAAQRVREQVAATSGRCPKNS
ncbi:MAG: hypothetical protein VB137_10395 [Burkholderia sp.]